MARKGHQDRGLLSKLDSTGKPLWYVRLMHEGKERRFGSFPTKTKARQFYAKAKTEQHEGISGEAMIADLVFVRPLGIVAVAVGSVFFIVSLPFSLLGGNSKEAATKLVYDPANFTFSRPLGDF